MWLIFLPNNLQTGSCIMKLPTRTDERTDGRMNRIKQFWSLEQQRCLLFIRANHCFVLMEFITVLRICMFCAITPIQKNIVINSYKFKGTEPNFYIIFAIYHNSYLRKLRFNTALFQPSKYALFETMQLSFCKTFTSYLLTFLRQHFVLTKQTRINLTRQTALFLFD